MSAGCRTTEYISDELLKRHGDNVWRMRLRKNWLCLLLLVEFQSTDDPFMALRILTYTGLLYQALARNEELDADGRLPAVLPLVLYNGDEPWLAPVASSWVSGSDRTPRLRWMSTRRGVAGVAGGGGGAPGAPLASAGD